MAFTVEELQKMRIGVLLGGRGSEREVSLKSGEAIATALETKGLKVVRIDVGTDIAKRLDQEGIEVAFLALHGRYGEDGCIQGLLESVDIPYTGSGVASSALAMDKVLSKTLFAAAGLPLAEWQVLPPDVSPEPENFPFGLPLVVKPSREGSSVGVHLVFEADELDAAVEDARKHCGQVLVERFVPGREINVGVLDGKALGAIEIIPASGFYDYEAKYLSDTTRYEYPADIAPELYREACELAVKAHHALSCEGATRADFILGDDGRFVLLEVNTLPGMTATSLLPKIAAGVGIDFPELCLRILSGASLKA